MSMLEVHRQWYRRLVDLGCDPDHYVYTADYPDAMEFLKGRRVHVLVDARPHLDNLPPVETFCNPDMRFYEMLKLVAVVDGRREGM